MLRRWCRALALFLVTVGAVSGDFRYVAMYPKAARYPSEGVAPEKVLLIVRHWKNEIVELDPEEMPVMRISINDEFLEAMQKNIMLVNHTEIMNTVPGGLDFTQYEHMTPEGGA